MLPSEDEIGLLSSVRVLGFETPAQILAAVFAPLLRTGPNLDHPVSKPPHKRSGRSRHWVKMKNPACEAVTREKEEDWS
jgi:hypothetical protein